MSGYTLKNTYYLVSLNLLRDYSEYMSHALGFGQSMGSYRNPDRYVGFCGL